MKVVYDFNPIVDPYICVVIMATTKLNIVNIR